MAEATTHTMSAGAAATAAEPAAAAKVEAKAGGGGKVEKKVATENVQIPNRIHTWPYLVRLEFICGLIIMIITTVWSITIDAPLEEPANPNRTPNPSKAPWYFLGLQEMLVYFDPWMAGVVLPSLIIVGLMVIPYIDINPRGNGYYTFQERKFAVSTFLFGFLVLWISLIFLGTFVRGPGWYLFIPGQYWDTHKTVALTNVDLPYMLTFRSELSQFIVGGILVLGYYPGLAIAGWLAFKKRPFFQKLGFVRYHILAMLWLLMFSLVFKVALRLGLNVKYIWTIPQFNLNF